jgi:hypothetical protein
MVDFHDKDPIKLQMALAEVRPSQADLMANINQVSLTLVSFAGASRRVADALDNLIRVMNTNIGDTNG